jgi:hypothetical protein
LGSYNAPVTSIDNKELTSTPSPVCTRVCTSEAENANAGTIGVMPSDAGIALTETAGTRNADQGNEGEGIDQGDPLATLAAAIDSLSPTDRQRLAAMLTGHQSEGDDKVTPPLVHGSYQKDKTNRRPKEQSHR